MKRLTSVMLGMLADAKAGRAEYKPAVAGGTGNYDGAWIKRPGTKIALLFEHSFDPMAAVDAATDAMAGVRNLYYYDTEHPALRRAGGIAASRVWRNNCSVKRASCFRRWHW